MKTKRYFLIIVSLLITATESVQASSMPAASDDEGTTSLLKGSLQTIKISKGAAVLRTGTNGLGFYYTANATIAANTAYTDLSKTILINIESLEQVADGITPNELSAETAKKTVFDSSGKQLNDEQRGLNIVQKRHINGKSDTKKIVVR